MRRISSTLLANKGADLSTIERHGGWRSFSVAESYIEDSISNKVDIARKIQGLSGTRCFFQEKTFIISTDSWKTSTGTMRSGADYNYKVFINGNKMKCNNKNKMSININVLILLYY